MKRLLLGLGMACSAALVCAQGYQVTAGAVYQDFQDTRSWVSYDGTVNADTAHVMLGTQSMMLTAVPGYNAHAQKSINTDFSAMNTMTVWVYAQYPVNDNGWHAASFYLTSDNFQDYFLAVTQKLHPGWSKLTFSKSDFQANGNPSWSAPMTKLEVAFFGDTSAGMSVSFADMELNGFSRPKVIIEFDDNYQSSYDYGYQYLKKYGMQGTEFVISSTVDGLGRTTTAELQEMYNYGWDMCNHTTTHPDLRTLTQAQVASEYQTCENFLVAHGWVRNQGYLHLAYPAGHFNSTVLAADQQVGLLTARTTMESLPQANLLDSNYLLYSQVPDSTSQNVGNILASVSQVVADGGALILTFHNITPTPQVAIDWKDADFYTIIDKIASLRSQGLLDVIPFTQWYAGLQQTVNLNYFQANSPQNAAGIQNTGLLFLSGPAPAAETVSLSASPANVVQLPSSTTIAAGAAKGTFPIASTWVDNPTVVTLTATLNGVTQTCTFTVLPKAPNLITLDSSSIKGGTTTTGHIWLNAPSPAGGCYVVITASDPSVTAFHSSVFIPAGWFHADFQVRTQPVQSNLSVTLTGRYNGYTTTATFAATP